MNENDHDLLIQIATKLDRAIQDIKELKDNTTARVSALEDEKANKIDLSSHEKLGSAVHSDHEKRIRRLERWSLLALGALGILEFLIQVIANIYKH